MINNIVCDYAVGNVGRKFTRFLCLKPQKIVNIKGLKYLPALEKDTFEFVGKSKVNEAIINNENFINLSTIKRGEIYQTRGSTIKGFFARRVKLLPKDHPALVSGKKEIEELRRISVDESSKLTNYESKPYDMPLKFMVSTNEQLLKTGSSLIVDDVPEMFKSIELKKVSKALDNLGNYLDKNKINYFEIAGKKFKAEFVGKGEIGEVYKISDTKGNSVAVKYFQDPMLIGLNGAYAEIPIAREASKAGVIDVAKFHMANPCGRHITYDGISSDGIVGGWQMTEFIEKSTPLKNNGKGVKFFDWLENHGLMLGDRNLGTKKGNYVIDVGGVVQLENKYDARIVTYGGRSFADELLTGYTHNEGLDDILKVFPRGAEPHIT